MTPKGKSVSDGEELVPPSSKVIAEVSKGPATLGLKEVPGGFEAGWSHGGVPVTELKGTDLLDAAVGQLRLLGAGGGSELKYQQFPAFDKGEFPDLEEREVSIGTVREGTDHWIRIITGDRRYELQYHIRPWKDPTPAYLISRLNSVGYPNVVEILGIGYWSLGGRNLPWLSVIRYPDDIGSGFSPYLSELNDLLTGALETDGGEIRDLMRMLSGSERTDSFLLSRKIGRAVGSLHGSLLIDGQPSSGRKRTEGDRIVRLFSRSKMRMEDIGDVLGRLSSYMAMIEKGLYRSLGEMESFTRPSGRKQKVVRRSGRERRGPLPGLSVLRGAFVQRQGKIRERFSLLRRFKGSPMVPSGLDTGLDHISLLKKEPIFKRFDWSFFDIEGDEPTKTLPLKDLSLVLNSLMKARYLSARRCFQTFPAEGMPKQLSLMYIDYNLAKDGYLSMMSDIPTISISGRKDVPFRYVAITSMVSSLWYEKNRNALIAGYNEGLTDSDAEDLLVYPRGVDTLEGIRLFQILASLSSLSSSLGNGGTSSIVGMESDLITALSV